MIIIKDDLDKPETQRCIIRQLKHLADRMTPYDFIGCLNLQFKITLLPYKDFP